MELNEFVEKFAEQFDDTDASEILATTEFHELDEWSSLTGMCVIALAKQNSASRLPDRNCVIA